MCRGMSELCEGVRRCEEVSFLFLGSKAETIACAIVVSFWDWYPGQRPGFINSFTTFDFMTLRLRSLTNRLDCACPWVQRHTCGFTGSHNHALRDTFHLAVADHLGSQVVGVERAGLKWRCGEGSLASGS